MKNVIPYGKQNITEEDIKTVVETLQHDFLTQGPKIKEFEEQFAEYIGSKYAVAVSNGTAALHLSAMAVGIEKGDKAITTPITFAASANSVLYCGGEVDFVDIDSKTFLLDLDKLEEKLEQASAGEYKAIIPVDFAGYPIDSKRLRTIANKYNLKIIEDACHAPGAFHKYKDKKEFAGQGNYADLSIFSFHPVKHIATGEGGMITTNDKYLYEKLLLLRSHGITKSTDLLHENHGGWYYEMQELGYNYRISDINCALGISQLKKAEQGLKRRNEIAQKYTNAFRNTNVISPEVSDNVYHAYHLYVIQISDRLGLYNYLRKHNIFAQVHYLPVHLHPYYKEMGWKKGDFPASENYYEQCLSLPMFPTLKEHEQDFVIEKVLNFVK